MEEIIQTWVFDFTDLSLKELSNIDSTVALSVRALMESKSEWKGTAAELFVELKKVAEILKINTKGNLLPKSFYKLNQTLQQLKTYLKFGITVEKKRYVKIIKFGS